MTTPPPATSRGSSRSDLLNLAIRMVTPLRREFGRSLDVPHFLQDFSYAKEVLDEASTSSNERLRDQAAYFHAHLIGPRAASAAASPTAAVAAVATVAVTAAISLADQADAAERQASPQMVAELQQRMLNKYRSGIR